MKQLIYILVLTAGLGIQFFTAAAQAPSAFPYQAVARNNGTIVQNQNISARFSIHNGSATGTMGERETQNVTTNAVGWFSVNIGEGIPVSGTMSAINWETGDKYIRVEIDVAGGTSFIDMGTTKLSSVPYALFAKNGPPAGTANGQMLYWDGNAWVSTAAPSNRQSVKLVNGVPKWVPASIRITTTSISSIYPNHATSGGFISNNGGGEIIARGVCFSTLSNPTLANGHTLNGIGSADYISGMEGLTASTTYHVRAYAINIVGDTAYGNDLTFSTLAGKGSLASIQTINPAITTLTSATCGGVVSGLFSSTVTSRGICYSILPNPTIMDSIIINGSGSGSFASLLTGLTAKTTYYIRSYCINPAGVTYGNEAIYEASFTIGKEGLGGIVFYVDSTGQHGFISDSTDLGTAKWGCSTFGVSGTLPDVGTGMNNTNSINAICYYSFENGIAARLCGNLVKNGYGDWFLPSKGELSLMYYSIGFGASGANRNKGNFSSGYYWSSTQHSLFPYAYALDLGNGYSPYMTKDNTLKVRAIRAF